MPGRLVHFEVPAYDTGRALAFYMRALGWSFRQMEGPLEYHLTRVSKHTGGAIHRAEQDVGIPGIFVYFDVEDIKEGAQRVRELGGKAEKLGLVPRMGWYARCTDTEGNQFGLWQNDPSAPAVEGDSQ
jgi:predicted enzyme related to lactoylglutathione lyase